MRKLFVVMLVLASFLAGRTVSAQETSDESVEVVSSVQERASHIMFKGIPLDGTLKSFNDSLVARGFTVITSDSKVSILKGSFAGVDNVLVTVFADRGFVWRVSAAFPARKYWAQIKRLYEDYRDMYRSKFGLEPDRRERLSKRFPEGSGSEAWGFEDESSVYESVFTFEDGDVIVSVRFDRQTQGFAVLVDYVDRLNSTLRSLIDMEDI